MVDLCGTMACLQRRIGQYMCSREWYCYNDHRSTEEMYETAENVALTAAYCDCCWNVVCRKQWSAAVLHWEGWQGVVAATQSHVLQPPWLASVSQLRAAQREINLCHWRNWRLRSRVGMPFAEGCCMVFTTQFYYITGYSFLWQLCYSAGGHWSSSVDDCDRTSLSVCLSVG